MVTLYDIKNDKLKLNTCLHTLKDCVWCNLPIESIEHDEKKRIIFKNFLNVLIGTPEWWEAIDNDKIITNEYNGKLVHTYSLKSSVGISLVTEDDGKKINWPVDYLAVYNDLKGRFIRFTYVSYVHTTRPTHSNLYNSIIGDPPLFSKESPAKFILKIEVEE
jgi:hypothetical protein